MGIISTGAPEESTVFIFCCGSHKSGSEQAGKWRSVAQSINGGTAGWESCECKHAYLAHELYAAANDHGKSDRTDHDDDGNETARNVTFIVGGLGRCLLAA